MIKQNDKLSFKMHNIKLNTRLGSLDSGHTILFSFYKYLLYGILPDVILIDRGPTLAFS